MKNSLSIWDIEILLFKNGFNKFNESQYIGDFEVTWGHSEVRLYKKGDIYIGVQHQNGEFWSFVIDNNILKDEYIERESYPSNKPLNTYNHINNYGDIKTLLKFTLDIDINLFTFDENFTGSFTEEYIREYKIPLSLFDKIKISIVYSKICNPNDIKLNKDRLSIQFRYKNEKDEDRFYDIFYPQTEIPILDDDFNRVCISKIEKILNRVKNNIRYQNKYNLKDKCREK